MCAHYILYNNRNWIVRFAMELAIKTREIEWWFWAVTFAFILLALVGWIPGY